MSVVIDVRGLSCPSPVLLVIKEIEKRTGSFEILIDTECSKENIARVLKNCGYEKEEKEEDGYTVFRVRKVK